MSKKTEQEHFLSSLFLFTACLAWLKFYCKTCLPLLLAFICCIFITKTVSAVEEDGNQSSRAAKSLLRLPLSMFQHQEGLHEKQTKLEEDSFPVLNSLLNDEQIEQLTNNPGAISRFSIHTEGKETLIDAVYLRSSDIDTMLPGLSETKGPLLLVLLDNLQEYIAHRPFTDSVKEERLIVATQIRQSRADDSKKTQASGTAGTASRNLSRLLYIPAVLLNMIMSAGANSIMNISNNSLTGNSDTGDFAGNAEPQEPSENDNAILAFTLVPISIVVGTFIITTVFIGGVLITVKVVNLVTECYKRCKAYQNLSNKQVEIKVDNTCIHSKHDRE